MRKKFTMLLASLFLVMGTAWADNMRFDAKSTPALPGTKENNQYTWKSSEMTAPDGFTTLRLTFLENEGNGADKGGFPHVALAEFYLYDKDGQPVGLSVEQLSSNATETAEGNSGIHKLCDGYTTRQEGEGQYDWYWHSYWSANAGAYHYLEINVADIANLSTFAIGYVSRQSDGTPTEILVTTGSSTADVAAQYNSYMLFSGYDLSTQAFRVKNSNITNEERFLTIETPNLNDRDEDGVKILPKSYGDESEAQAWKFIPQDDGTYRIQSASGYFLNNHDTWGINAEDDTQGHELDNPKFTLEYLKDGEFRIKSVSGYVGPNNSYSTDHPYEMFGNHAKEKQYIDWKIEPYTKQYIITCEYVLGDKSVSTTSYCTAGETYSFSNPYGFTTVTSCTKNGTALTASNGTYSFTATEHANVTVVLEENLPFTPTTITNQGAFADNTVWYILMQKTTNNYWKYHSEGDNNVRATTSDNSIYDEKQMWCFTGNALEGFKIYNKSLGTNHSLSNGDPAKLVENNAQTWYARESNKAFAASDIRFGLARPGETGNSEYANLQTTNDVLKGWSLDAGSTTCAVPITEKYAEIAAVWEKLLTVEEGAIGSLTTTEGFQTLIDAYKATPSQETENAVNEFIAANDFELENGCYYMIVSAYDAFKNNQGVEKAIYSDNSDLKWATRDNGNKAYYWEAVTVDGQLRFKNCNDGSYYMAAKTTTIDGSTSTDIVMWNGEASADAAISYNAKFEANTTNVLTQLNIRLGETGNLHANSHDTGNGSDGNIIFFGSGANGASAWRVIKSEHPELAAAKGALQARIDELNVIVANMGNAVGQNKEGDKDALLTHKQTAEGVMEGGSETPETYTEALTILNNSLAALDFSVILPQAGKHYLIKSAKPEFFANQDVEMAMYSNASNGLLYWKALDEGDRTFYWTITPNNDGTSFVFQNAGDNKYIPAIANDQYTMTEDANSAQSFNLSFLGSRQFNITGSGTMHMMGHSNGNGTTGRICGYDGGLNTPSAWYIVEAELPSTFSVTYKFNYQGDTKYTQTEQVAFGGEYPEMNVTLPYGVTSNFERPTEKVQAASERVFELTVQGLPFEFSDSYANAVWYYMPIHSTGKYYLSYVANQTSITLEDDKKMLPADGHDAYLWAFVGDPFTGYKIMNKAAGDGKILSSSETMSSGNGETTYPLMVDGNSVPTGNNTYWIPSSASSNATNGFYLEQKGYPNNKMNRRGSNLAYWSTGKDGGSTFRVTTLVDDDDMKDVSDVAETAGKVGYPTSTSDAYKTLTGLDRNRTTKLDAQAAISNFKKSSDIVLPEDGKAYTIANYSLYRYGTTRYLNYTAGNALSVNEDKAMASVFVCKKLSNGTYTFVTEDGKVLTWMHSSEGYKENDAFRGYSSNYAAYYNKYSDWNRITVKKNGNTEDDFGHLRLVARRYARDNNPYSSFIIQGNNGNWDRAGDSYFLQTPEQDQRCFSSAWILSEVEEHTNTDAENLAIAKVAALDLRYDLLAEGIGGYHYVVDDVEYYTKDVIYNATSVDAVNEIASTFAINQPTAGFYRVKSMNGKDAAKKGMYWQVNADATSMELNATAHDFNSIMYVTEGKFITYKAGLYLSNYNTLADVESEPKVWSIMENGEIPGTYALQYEVNGWNNGYLSDWYGLTNGLNDGNAAWIFEEVTSLPVAISNAQVTFNGDTKCVSTLFAPVALEVPAGITAYIGVNEDNYLAMEAIEAEKGAEKAIIPANTGVILMADADGTYDFTISSETGTAIEPGANIITGTVAKTIITPATINPVANTTCYVLAKKDEKVGLYRASLNKNDGKGFINNACKAYIPVTGGQNAPALVMRFGRGQGTTEIELPTANGQQPTAVYDLQGRRVLNPTKGMYIVNGKKVVIR